MGGSDRRAGSCEHDQGAAVVSPMPARDPHTPITRNCGCAVEAGVSISGIDVDGVARFIADFEAAHGPDGCGGELVHRAESSMGRKAKPKRGGRVA